MVVPTETKENRPDATGHPGQSGRRTAVQGLQLVEAERRKARRDREEADIQQIAHWLADQCARWSEARAAGAHV